LTPTWKISISTTGNLKIKNRFGAPVPQLQILADQLVGKCGLIFTNQSVFELKTIIESNRKESVAKVGTEAPVEVLI
jgi:hypothetical protein